MNGHTLYMPVPRHLFQKASPVPSSASYSPHGDPPLILTSSGWACSWSPSEVIPGTAVPSTPVQPLGQPFQRTRECGWPKHPAPLWKHRKTWLEPSWLVTILPYFVQLCPSSQWPQATWETNASRCFIWTNTSQLGKAAASSVFLALA